MQYVIYHAPPIPTVSAFQTTIHTLFHNSTPTKIHVQCHIAAIKTVVCQGVHIYPLHL